MAVVSCKKLSFETTTAHHKHTRVFGLLIGSTESLLTTIIAAYNLYSCIFATQQKF